MSGDSRQKEGSWDFTFRLPMSFFSQHFASTLLRPSIILLLTNFPFLSSFLFYLSCYEIYKFSFFLSFVRSFILSFSFSFVLSFFLLLEFLFLCQFVSPSLSLSLLHFLFSFLLFRFLSVLFGVKAFLKIVPFCLFTFTQLFFIVLDLLSLEEIKYSNFLDFQIRPAGVNPLK